MGRPILVCYFLAFIFVSSIALMNLVTATIVETSFECSNSDKEVLLEVERRQKQQMVAKLRKLFLAADADGSGYLTVQELRENYALPEFRSQLEVFGSLEELVRVFDLCDLDGGGALSAVEFLDGMMRYEEDRVLYICSRIYELLRMTARSVDAQSVANFRDTGSVNTGFSKRTAGSKGTRNAATPWQDSDPSMRREMAVAPLSQPADAHPLATAKAAPEEASTGEAGARSTAEEGHWGKRFLEELQGMREETSQNLRELRRGIQEMGKGIGKEIRGLREQLSKPEPSAVNAPLVWKDKPGRELGHTRGCGACAPRGEVEDAGRAPNVVAALHGER